MHSHIPRINLIFIISFTVSVQPGPSTHPSVPVATGVPHQAVATVAVTPKGDDAPVILSIQGSDCETDEEMSELSSLPESEATGPAESGCSVRQEYFNPKNIPGASTLNISEANASDVGKVNTKVMSPKKAPAKRVGLRSRKGKR